MGSCEGMLAFRAFVVKLETVEQLLEKHMAPLRGFAPFWLDTIDISLLWSSRNSGGGRREIERSEPLRRSDAPRSTLPSSVHMAE